MALLQQDAQQGVIGGSGGKGCKDSKRLLEVRRTWGETTEFFSSVDFGKDFEHRDFYQRFSFFFWGFTNNLLFVLRDCDSFFLFSVDLQQKIEILLLLYLGSRSS